jgi:hypothetical protein
MISCAVVAALAAITSLVYLPRAAGAASDAEPPAHAGKTLARSRP